MSSSTSSSSAAPPRVSRLPDDASLEHLRHQARALQKSIRAGDAAALERLRLWHPRPPAETAALALADAQVVVARGYGFPSWPRLKRHLEMVAAHRWDPPQVAASTSLEPAADTFLRHACLDYDRWHPSHLTTARRLLEEHPDLAGASIHAAAAIGEVPAVERFLHADPTSARRKGGPLGWEPLLYACYSRLDSTAAGHSTLEVARLLLDHGADPDSGFLWRGLIPPFTALTGAFGEGEGGNTHPPHQHRDALVRLLLERGADPNDGQTLYNRHFRADDGHLQLLLPAGLGRDHGGPWYKRLGDRLAPPAQLLVEELCGAAKANLVARAALLVQHGAEVNRPGVRNSRTALAMAEASGNREIVELLTRAGATPAPLSPEEALAAACLGADEPAARALLAAHPELLVQVSASPRTDLLARAVQVRRPAAVRLIVALGVDVNLCHRTTALHEAAWAGDLEMVDLLLSLGADPDRRDREHNGTPLDWATYNGQTAVADRLRPLTAG